MVHARIFISNFDAIDTMGSPFAFSRQAAVMLSRTSLYSSSVVLKYNSFSHPRVFSLRTNRTTSARYPNEHAYQGEGLCSAWTPYTFKAAMHWIVFSWWPHSKANGMLDWSLMKLVIIFVSVELSRNRQIFKDLLLILTDDHFGTHITPYTSPECQSSSLEQRTQTSKRATIVYCTEGIIRGSCSSNASAQAWATPLNQYLPGTMHSQIMLLCLFLFINSMLWSLVKYKRRMLTYRRNLVCSVHLESARWAGSLTMTNWNIPNNKSTSSISFSGRAFAFQCTW